MSAHIQAAVPQSIYDGFASARFDLPELLEPPTHTYAVAANERTGSTLLCRELTVTGLLGMPANYLHPHWVRIMLARARPAERHLDMLYRLRSTPNKCFGIKFHHAHQLHENPEIEKFDPQVWVWCTRKDTLAQAISWATALQTNSYISLAPELREPEYDFNHILHTIKTFKHENEQWERYLNTQSKPVWEVPYGERHIQEDVKAVLDIVGPTMMRIPAIPFPPMEKQAGERSEEWTIRFLLDCGKYHVKPDPLWGSEQL